MDDPADLVCHVRAAQTRNHEAFLVIVEGLRPRLWARALSWAKDRSAAEDLLQETCLRAYDKIRELREPRAVASWMLTILDRLAQRTQQTEDARGVEVEVGEEITAAYDGQALLEVCAWQETKAELQAALAALPGTDREILSLRFGAELNAAQIAEELGMEAGAVRTRLCRILARLRQRMRVNT